MKNDKLDINLKTIINFDKKAIFEEINHLKNEIGIYKKFNESIEFIEDVDSIYLTNFDIYTKNIKKEILQKKDKSIELRCFVKKQKIYLKNFGKIENLEVQYIQKILKFIFLIKLAKNINEDKILSSKIFLLNKQIKQSI